MRSEELCRDDTGMDGVAGAGLRFICGGKVRDYTVAILGTTLVAQCVCVNNYTHLSTAKLVIGTFM